MIRLGLRTRTGKGTAGQFSGKLRHRKGSVSGKFQRDPYFGLEIDESSGLTESTTSMPDMLTFLRQWPSFDWMKIIFSVIEIQVEALYFYAPVINDERKCFDMHQQFLENAFVLGFFLICIHMVIFLSYKNPLGFVINFLIYYSILAVRSILQELCLIITHNLIKLSSFLVKSYICSVINRWRVLFSLKNRDTQFFLIQWSILKFFFVSGTWQGLSVSTRCFQRL